MGGGVYTPTNIVSYGGTLYAGISVPTGTTSEVRLVRSGDRGLTWAPVGRGLETARAVTVLSSGAGSLYAGTNAGIFRSLDGESFSPYGTAIGNVLSMALSADALYAGLVHGGILKVDLAPATTRLVPIVLDVDTGSARFKTELSLVNTGSRTVTATLLYTASIGSGSGTVTEELAAGRQLVLPDAITYLRDKGLAIPVEGAQGGTLLVRFEGYSDDAAVFATARTTTAAGNGRAGLAYSGLRPEEGGSAPLTLYGLRANATDRSNVAVFSTGTEPVTLRVTVFSGDGDARSVIVASEETLPAYGWKQYSGILKNVDVANGWVTVERVSARGSFSAYGVINDETTSDGSYVPPIRTAGSSAFLRYLTVPVLVEAGAFLSELVLTNTSDVELTFELSYLESLNAAGGRGTAVVKLAPRSQRVIPDAVEFLRKSGVPLAPRGSGGFAGTLHVITKERPVSFAFAGARTAAQAPGGGQFGLFTPGVYPSDELYFSGTLFGLKADAENRSNLAVFNTGGAFGEDVSLELQAYDGDAGGAAKGDPLTLTLKPGQWSQPTFFGARGIRSGWVKVTRKSGVGTWGAYGVINDGASAGERTGDGAYVPPVF